MRPYTWRDLWAEAEADLGSRLEARRVVERASGHDGADLVVHLGEQVPTRAVAFARAMVARRQTGEPLQYVLGHWAFRRLELLVDRRVLIPRPETEVTVGAGLQALRRHPRPPTPVVVDLGTGSGAIALAIADEAATAEVWATDVSSAALSVARANLAGLGSERAVRVRLAEGPWYAALPPDLRGRADLVISNPPYVGDTETLPDEVERWEPAEALRSGPTGLEAIGTVVGEAPAWLAPEGTLVVEIAPHQAAEALGLARRAGFTEVSVERDLADRERVLVARR